MNDNDYGLKSWAEAFNIFAKYSDDRFRVGAEHDCVFVWVDPEEVSQEDRDRLKQLGWTFNWELSEEEKREYYDEDGDPPEGWMDDEGCFRMGV